MIISNSVGGPIDIQQKGWKLVIHDHDHYPLAEKVR